MLEKENCLICYGGVNKNGIKIRLKVDSYTIKSILRIYAIGEPTFFLRKFPSFLICGAQKAGTTSLFNYIAKHSQIRLPKEKEIHYFDLRFHRKTLIWYKSCFPILLSNNYFTFEATPEYMFHPKCPERIHRVLPNVKLIFILRNPIDRAYSHFQMNKRGGIEPFDFKRAIEMEKERLSYEKEKVFKDDRFVWMSCLRRNWNFPQSMLAKIKL